jgi:hypothetical protein
VTTLWTVAETVVYLADAVKLYSEEERDSIIKMLATDPECGDVMPRTGGVRKVRVGRDSRGKSGGARVIYYFHGSDRLPIYVLAIFGKNEKDNLSEEEKNALRKFVAVIKESLK